MHDLQPNPISTSFASALDAVPDCIQIADELGIVVQLNATAQKVARLAHHDKGDHWALLWLPLEYEKPPAWRVGNPPIRFKARIANDGPDVWDVLVSSIPSDIAPTMAGAGMTVTARRIGPTPEGFSIAEQKRLQLALSSGKMGTWDLDLSTQAMACSAQCKMNYGYGPEDIFGYEELSQSIHPDDGSHWRAAVESAARRGGDFSIEYRTIWPDGKTHWAYVHGTCFHDDAGVAKSMAGISQDITERKEVEERLRILALDRKRVDQHRTEFLATLAHELRNPLAPIQNGVLLLSLGHADETRRTSIYAMMERQIHQMTHLINGLLDVARIERGEIELKLSAVDFKAAIQSAVESASPLISERGHTLTMDLPTGPILIQADSTRVTQMIVNMLNNAAKYTPKGGSVSLTVSQQGDRVVARLIDNGIGMSADTLSLVFEMFSQGTDDRTLSHGGLGIGLSLVRKLAELHGGSITAASAGPGLGSEFTLSLPLATP